MERFGAILGQHGARRRPGAAHPARLRAPRRSTCTRARRCGGCSTSAWCPIVNENDTVADDEIRYGDNDRLAALVANLVRRRRARAAHRHRRALHRRSSARRGGVAHRGDRRGRRRARGGRRAAPAPQRGSGGMASKLAAAKIAAWSGVRAVIAAAESPGVVLGGDRRASPSARWSSPGRSGCRAASSGSRSPRDRPAGSWSTPGPGPRSSSTAARCCPPACGRSRAASRPTRRSRSSASDGRPFAKGLVRYPAALLRQVAGRRTDRAARRVAARGHPPRRPRRPALRSHRGALARTCGVRHTTAPVTLHVISVLVVGRRGEGPRKRASTAGEERGSAAGPDERVWGVGSAARQRREPPRKSGLAAPPNTAPDPAAPTNLGIRPFGQRRTLRPMSEHAAVVELGRRAKAASRRLAGASTADKDAALLAAADLLVERAPEILAANAARPRRRRRPPASSAGAARPAAAHRRPHRRAWPTACARSPRCPTRSARCSTGGAAPTGCGSTPGAGAARGGRDHLREPPQRHQRRRRPLPEVGQRGASCGARAAALRSNLAIADGAARRRSQKAGLPEDAVLPRRRRRATRPRSRSCSSPTSSTASSRAAVPR